MGVGRASRTPVTYPFEKALEAADGELWVDGATENELVAAVVILEASQVLLEVELAPRVLASSSTFTLAARGSCEVGEGRNEGLWPKLIGKLDIEDCNDGEAVGGKPGSSTLDVCGCEDRSACSDAVVKKLPVEDEGASVEADIIKTVEGIVVESCSNGIFSPARLLYSECGASVELGGSGAVNGPPDMEVVG